jgi:hypothetical protein
MKKAKGLMEIEWGFYAGGCFRPMSPTEARSWGADSGVMETEEGRGYPVTWVAL